jgi:hypothetical protein
MGRPVILLIYFAVSIASVSTGVSDLGKQGVEWRRPRVAVPAIVRASAPMIPQQVYTIARSERPHRHVIWPRIGAQDRPVVALPAAHVERPHAVGAHVAEGHRRPGLRSGLVAHAGGGYSRQQCHGKFRPVRPDARHCGKRCRTRARVDHWQGRRHHRAPSHSPQAGTATGCG